MDSLCCRMQFKRAVVWPGSLLFRNFRPDRIAPNVLVGIDLGTTNSSIAIVDDNGPVVLSDSEGRKSVPSEVVWVNKKELRIVGEGNGAHDDPLFYSFKRYIGLTCGEVSTPVRDSLQYSLTDSDDGVECLASSGGCFVSPVALSAIIIRHLMQSIDDIVYGIEGAVVAVPAHFSPSQKQATILATEEAGIKKVHLLQEPVAAALAYGIDGGSDGETVLVFDWGGGTFDVSVLQAFEGIMEILGTDGNQFLGGDDIDQLLVNHVYSSSEDKTLNAFRRCRAAKEQLAYVEQSEISLENGNTVTITRNELESLCHPLFREIATVLKRIGHDLFIEWDNDPFDSIGPDSTNSSTAPTDLTPSNTDPWAAPPRKITKVVLVGQITRLPMVVEYIRRVTGVTPCCSVDPGEAVAIGAATQAGILEGSVGSVELMDGSYSIDLHDRTTGFSNWQP